MMKMKEIDGAGDLIAAATRQGIELNSVEADIILGYIGGHDYALLMGEDFQTALHDLNDGGGHENDMEYNVRQVIEFCREMNGELLLENSSKDEPDEEYLLDLRKDELILDRLMKRAETAIPPVIREYKVVIVEHLKKVIPVEAASWGEAEMKVKDAWKNGEHVLTAEDFAGVSFTLGE